MESMTTNNNEKLESLYQNALIISTNDSYEFNLTMAEKDILDEIIRNSEGSKAVLTVIITSIYYKILHPEQDIRNHQAKMPGWYSWRSFDKDFITPFLKSKQFPAMSESGWLTRSLEQPHPFNLDFPWSISPKIVKIAFLEIIEKIESGWNYWEYLNYILVWLIKKRDSQSIRLARPGSLPIKTISEYIHEHFNSSYSSAWASRLPTLAIYAAYQCLINELKRFDSKILLPLENHTSADSQSWRIGDIDLIDENSKSFEAVEIKHNIVIRLQIVRDAFEKFKTTQVQRYYILSTAGISEPEKDEVYRYVESVRTSHWCQIVVNGVEDTLKYYLRLLENPADFIEKYATLLEIDGSIKFEHRRKWNDIASRL